MQAPDRPTNESDRLQRLRALELLDTPPEARFDRITRLAALALGLPAACLALVDEARVCFKSREGLAAAETAREGSCFAAALLEPELLVVEDAQSDPRFRNHVLVQEGFRFFAGQPLGASEGAALGVFAVLDTRPRQLDEGQRHMLAEFAALAEAELLRQDSRRLWQEKDRFFSLSVDPMSVGEFGGVFHQVSPAFERVLGWSAADLASGSFLDIVHPEDRERARSTLAARRQGGSFEETEVRCRTKDGQWRWLSWRGQVEGGRIYAIARDITPRKHLEARLHLQARATEVLTRSRSLEQAAPELLAAVGESLGLHVGELWLPDAEGLLTVTQVWHSGEAALTAFAEAARPLRLAKNEGLLGQAWIQRRPVWTRWLEGRPDFIREQAARAAGLRTGVAVPLLSGEEFLGLIGFFSLDTMDEDPELLEALATFARIVAQFIVRRRVQDALAASEERHRLMVEGLHEGVVLQDAEGRILTCNSRAQEILGLGAEELRGSSNQDARWRTYREDGSIWPQEETPDAVALRTGEPQVGALLGIDRGGARVWLLVNATPLQEGGRVGGVLVSFTDITEQRRAFERFRVIFEQSSDAHLLFDGSGILDCNRAAVEMLGCRDKAEVLSLHPSELSPEFQPDGGRSDQPTTWREDYARAHGCCRFEWMHRSRGGRDFLTEVSLTPVELEGRQVFMEVWHDLTERVKAEQVQRRLLEILESTPDLVGIATVEGEVIYVNRAMRLLRGLGEGAAPQWPDHTPRSERTLKEAAVPTALRHSIWIGESELVDATGCVVPVWQILQAQKDSDGRVSHLATLARDLRPLRDAEAALRESEARFRTLATSSPVGIFETDAQGQCTYMNARNAAILGLEPEAALGLDWLSVVHPEDRTMLQERWAEAVAEGQELPVEYRVLRPDGSVVWAFGQAAPMLDAQGQVSGYVGVLVDLTQQHRTVDALRLSEAKNKALLEALPDQLFLQAGDGTYLQVWGGHDKPLVVDAPEQLLGRRMEEILPPEIAARRLEAIQQALKTGETQVLDFSLEMRGQQLFYEARSLAAGPDQCLVVLRDTTARNEMDRIKREFVSTVSHELRTPLTSIRGSLGLLASRAGSMDPESQELVAIARNNTERLMQLVNDILDLERAEGGVMEFRPRLQSLAALLRQSASAMEGYGHSMNVSFRLEAPEPDSPGDLTCSVDGDRLQQVLANLLSNAAKFSPAGSQVKLRLERREDQARIEVENEGPGVPASFRARIFQKFAQGDASQSRQRGGAGLGLSIAKAMVERMGGRIGFESEPGRTVFFVEFPLKPRP